MVIIIVTIFVILVTICCYIRYYVRDVREAEKEFYDILFLAKFFQIISENGIWDNFIRKNNEISVTRKIINAPLYEENKRSFRENTVYFEITGKKLNDDSHINNEDKYLCYEFRAGESVLSVIAKVKSGHFNLMNSMKKSYFNCRIDKNMIKMIMDGTVEKVIYISSVDAIYQSLSLILQNKESVFRDNENYFWESSYEIIETYNVIAFTKAIISNHGCIIHGLENKSNQQSQNKKL